MVKRYTNWCIVSHGHDMAPDDKGNYVLYSDYLLLAEALKEAIYLKEDWLCSHMGYLGSKSQLRLDELRKLIEE